MWHRELNFFHQVVNKYVLIYFMNKQYSYCFSTIKLFPIEIRNTYSFKPK